MEGDSYERDNKRRRTLNSLASDFSALDSSTRRSKRKGSTGSGTSSCASKKANIQPTDSSDKAAHDFSGQSYSPDKLVSGGLAYSPAKVQEGAGCPTSSADIEAAYEPSNITSTSQGNMLSVSAVVHSTPFKPAETSDCSAQTTSEWSSTIDASTDTHDLATSSLRGRIAYVLRELTDDLRARGAVLGTNMVTSMHRVEGSPFNTILREDGLMDMWDEAMEASGYYESQLSALKNNMNRLSKRMADMMRDGGILINEAGPSDHESAGCCMCKNCRGHLLLMHNLMKRLSGEAHKAKTRVNPQPQPIITRGGDATDSRRLPPSTSSSSSTTHNVASSSASQPTRARCLLNNPPQRPPRGPSNNQVPSWRDM